MSNTQPTNAFGKTNIDPVYDGPAYFKLKTPDAKKGETMTELVVRLLPSMKSYRDSGEWKFFYGQHYGYYGTNPRNPDKPRPRPFACIQKKNGKTKEIVDHCPKCDQIEAQRKKYEEREQALLKAHPGIDPKVNKKEWREVKDADAKLKALSEWLRKHNCDKKFWMNVMSKDGKFGVLQLSYKTTKDVLMPFLKKLRDEEKMDPFDPAGAPFLKFTRTGQKPQVVDAVGLYQEKIEVEVGGKLKKLDETVMSTLTDEQIARALKQCPDLKLEAVQFLAFEKIEQLVNSSGSAEEVDAIWGDPPAKKGAPEDAQSLEGEGESPEGSQQSQSNGASQQQSQPEQGSVEEEDEIAKAEAALKAAREAAAAKKAAQSKPATTPKKDSGMGPKVESPASFIDEMEDFDQDQP